MPDLADLISLYGSREAARREYERLCVYLAKAEDPRAQTVETNPGDEGVDIYIGEWSDPDGIRVFQAKYYVDELSENQWKNVFRSFRRALKSKHFRLRHWTLCLPRNLTPDEILVWERWSRRVASKYQLLVDTWLDADLQLRLTRRENLSLRDATFRYPQSVGGRSVKFVKQTVFSLDHDFVLHTRSTVRRSLILGGLLALCFFAWVIFFDNPGMAVTGIGAGIGVMIMGFHWWGKARIGNLLFSGKGEEVLLDRQGEKGQELFAFRTPENERHAVYFKWANCVFDGCSGRVLVGLKNPTAAALDTSTDGDIKVSVKRDVEDEAGCECDPRKHRYWVDANDMGFSIDPAQPYTEIRLRTK